MKSICMIINTVPVNVPHCNTVKKLDLFMIFF